MHSSPRPNTPTSGRIAPWAVCLCRNVFAATLVPSFADPSEAEATARGMRRACSRVRPAGALPVRARAKLHALRSAEGEAFRAALAARHRAVRGGTVQCARFRQLGD